MSAIAIHNVSKRFGEHQAVNGVSLTVPEGSIYGFIGPNGSGKPMAEVDVAIKDGLGRLQLGDWADKKGRDALKRPGPEGSVHRGRGLEPETLPELLKWIRA